MPALNFTVFTDKILSGEKQQTIRPPREKPIEVGDKPYLYTRMRAKNCLKLGEAVCSEVVPIKMSHLNGILEVFPINPEKTCGAAYNVAQYRALALDDGFDGLLAFANFFAGTYKLKPGDSKDMVIIKWRDFILETT